MKMWKFFVISSFVIFAILTGAKCLTIDQCEDGALPLKVSVANCTKEDWLCYIRFNAPLEIEMTFNTPHYLENITPKLTAHTVLGNFTITVSKKEENACMGLLNTFCPLTAKEYVRYQLHANLLLIPLVPVKMKFELIDVDLQETVVCFRTDVYPVIPLNSEEES